MSKLSLPPNLASSRPTAKSSGGRLMLGRWAPQPLSAMNPHIASRLSGIHSVLWSAFEAGSLLSSSSKGYECETFISLFLSEVLPPIYRFGTGEITDSLMNGDPSRRSGQIDIVIEMP